MKILLKNLPELKYSGYNPRLLTKKQRDDLTTSMKKFGFAQPIVINCNPKRRNVIVGGHQRVDIAKELGIKKIPCVEVNLPLKDERELNLRLNRNLGDFDYDKLLKEFDVTDLLNFGFEKSELNIDASALVGDPGPEKQPRNEVKFQLGDVRFLVPVKVYRAWMNKLVKEIGAQKENQIDCLKNRLKLE